MWVCFWLSGLSPAFCGGLFSKNNLPHNHSWRTKSQLERRTGTSIQVSGIPLCKQREWLICNKVSQWGKRSQRQPLCAHSWVNWVKVSHAFKPQNSGVRARHISVSTRPSWSTLQIPGQSELHSKMLSPKRKKRKKEKKKEKVNSCSLSEQSTFLLSLTSYRPKAFFFFLN